MKNSHSRLLAVAAAAAAAFFALRGPQGSAAEPAPPEVRIAVVDVVRIFKESAAHKKALADADRRVEEQAQILKKEYLEVERLRQEITLLRKDGPEYEPKAQEIVKREAMLKYRSDQSRGELDQSLQRDEERVYEAIREAIRAEAMEKGYTLVLKAEEAPVTTEVPGGHFAKMNIRTVLYHDKSWDITAAILRRCDEASRDAAPAPPANGPGPETPSPPPGTPGEKDPPKDPEK